MRTPADSIVAYVRAKDGNRPHLMTQAFTEDASLAMLVNTRTISFPPLSSGRDAIAEVLVRRFAQTYENVYTLCLAAAPGERAAAFTCDWLVVMTEKESGAVRVGCGRYDWCFSPESHLAERLAITIDTMQLLPSCDLAAVMNWVSALPYPWCAPELVMHGAPHISDLSPVFGYIVKEGALDHSPRSIPRPSVSCCAS